MIKPLQRLASGEHHVAQPRVIGKQLIDSVLKRVGLTSSTLRRPSSVESIVNGLRTIGSQKKVRDVGGGHRDLILA
jgi:hypothetical protein